MPVHELQKNENVNFLTRNSRKSRNTFWAEQLQMSKHIAIEPDRNHIIELQEQYEQDMGYSEHDCLSQLILYRVFND